MELAGDSIGSGGVDAVTRFVSDSVASGNFASESFASPAHIDGKSHDFWELKDASKMDIQSAIKALWEEVWGGRLTADTWEPVRKGLVNGFVPKDENVDPPADDGPIPLRRRSIPRALRERWRAGPPVTGRWYSLVPDIPADYSADPLDREELDRDRVRLLLKRWGILCRPLLERELPSLSWGRLLPVMRRLELAGELTAGRFFSGINSLQFASPHIAAELEACDTCGTSTASRIYWMNAADPASPCGLALEGLDPNLPSRLPGNRLCFRGTELAAVSLRNGKELRIFVPPETAELPQILEFLKAPRLRAVDPERKIVVETINGISPSESPYTPALTALGFEEVREKLILW
jgi:ATP-dependent Lhr-like helicase